MRPPATPPRLADAASRALTSLSGGPSLRSETDTVHKIHRIDARLVAEQHKSRRPTALYNDHAALAEAAGKPQYWSRITSDQQVRLAPAMQ